MPESTISASEQNGKHKSVVPASDLECRCFDEYLHQLMAQSRGSLDFNNLAHLISAKPCWMRRKKNLTQGEQISGWSFAEAQNQEALLYKTGGVR